MTVTGAASIFGALVGAASAASLPFASALLTHTKRAGQQLPEVGPNFIRSYSSRSCCSVTDRSVHALRVRAARNNLSRAESFSALDIAVPRFRSAVEAPLTSGMFVSMIFLGRHPWRLPFNLGVPQVNKVDSQSEHHCREKRNAMLDLEDLQTFVEVADAGGVSPAARRLGVSKSIVSRRLFRLES